MQAVEIEQIMDEIREDIHQKGYADEELKFAAALANMDNVNLEECFNVLELRNRIEYLEHHHTNPIYFPLEGNPVKVFFQRAIRRILLFVIYPAFQYQNIYNHTVFRAFVQVKNYIAECGPLRRMPMKISALEKQISVQQEQIEALQAEINALKSEKKDSL